MEIFKIFQKRDVLYKLINLKDDKFKKITFILILEILK
jgi:hypothetical protein